VRPAIRGRRLCGAIAPAAGDCWNFVNVSRAMIVARLAFKAFLSASRSPGIKSEGMLRSNAP